MPSARDVQSHAEKILVIGNPGSGKTSLFTTLPGKKFIYIFDPNALSTLKGQDIDYEIFSPDLLDIDAVALKAGVRDKKVKADEPLQYINFEEHLEKSLDNGFFDNYDAIGFDSFTTFSDSVMDRILWLNKRTGKHPEQADYTATMNTVKNVIRTFSGMEKVFYATAHIETQKDEATGRLEYQPALIGRLRHRIPLLFSHMFYCFADRDDKDKVHFYISTKPDRRIPFVRSSLRKAAAEEEVTITDWSHPDQSGLGMLFKREGISLLDRGEKSLAKAKA